MCAVAYMEHMGTPLDFSHRQTEVAITPLAESELPLLQEFLRLGTNKQP